MAIGGILFGFALTFGTATVAVPLHPAIASFAA
jgi:hypothetical protein